MTLNAMPEGKSGWVISVENSGPHGLRLMELGVVPGVAIRVVKSAPLGDPIQICVRSYHLALRRAEAKSITVSLSTD